MEDDTPQTFSFLRKNSRTLGRNDIRLGRMVREEPQAEKTLGKMGNNL
jgi:hypothetical protein